jgi:hypothetical protein
MCSYRAFLGTFWSQTAQKFSKIAQTSRWGLFCAYFMYFLRFLPFLPILIDFFTERVGGYRFSFLSKRVGGPPYSDQRPTMVCHIFSLVELACIV